MTRPLVLLSVVATLAFACAQPQPQPPPQPGIAQAPPPDDDSSRLSLAERLIREAAARPAGGLSAERVAEALARAGLELSPPRQVLARTVGARFCMAAHTAAGLGVSICEFADDGAASAGLLQSRARFDGLIPDRLLARNRGTVLTLTRPPGSQALAGETARAARAFASL